MLVNNVLVQVLSVAGKLPIFIVLWCFSNAAGTITFQPAFFASTETANPPDQKSCNLGAVTHCVCHQTCSTVQITEPTFTGAKAQTFAWKCTCSVNQSIFAAIPCGTGVGWGPDLALSHQHSSAIAAVTPIRLHSGKGKANEDGFLPHTAAAERVTEGNTAGSCFIVALLTPRAAEVLLLLEQMAVCQSRQLPHCSGVCGEVIILFPLLWDMERKIGIVGTALIATSKSPMGCLWGQVCESHAG